MPGPLLAVDAPSLLFRAFHALPKTITDDRSRVDVALRLQHQILALNPSTALTALAGNFELA